MCMLSQNLATNCGLGRFMPTYCSKFLLFSIHNLLSTCTVDTIKIWIWVYRDPSNLTNTKLLNSLPKQRQSMNPYLVYSSYRPTFQLCPAVLQIPGNMVL